MKAADIDISKVRVLRLVSGSIIATLGNRIMHRHPCDCETTRVKLELLPSAKWAGGKERERGKLDGWSVRKRERGKTDESEKRCGERVRVSRAEQVQGRGRESNAKEETCEGRKVRAGYLGGCFNEVLSAD